MLTEMLCLGSLTHLKLKFVYDQFEVGRHKQKQFLALFRKTTHGFNYSYGQGHG